uniref:Reverse transcriptase zinc-binding domain-containing protein n=1 Tax=Hordeum vulgare subsp. vulgare TaxID=112509 RepID=A0A8I6X8W7_HORVV
MFTPNTLDALRVEVKNTLAIQSENWNEKYLGLPVHVGQSKRKAFAYIKGAVAGKVYGWKERLIAKRGKEVLVKTVAQAIPTYAMSCFYLTKSFCEELSSLLGRYWWSQQDKEDTIHWISWEKLTKPKSMGGLGFRDMECFNRAMLSRQIWRLIQFRDSLCARVLKARYFPNTHVLDASPKPGISNSWRSLLHGLELIKEGYIWRIGDEARVNIWRDPWIPWPWSRRVITPRRGNLLEYVSELIDPTSGVWDERLVRETFWTDDVHHILRIPLREGVPDFVAWQYDSKGEHSVRSAYKLQVKLGKPLIQGEVGASSATSSINQRMDDSWTRLWKLPGPRNIQMFTWRLKHESLALRSNLKKRGIPVEDTPCLFCGKAEEDGGHLFIKCKHVKGVWRALEMEQERGML